MSDLNENKPEEPAEQEFVTGHFRIKNHVRHSDATIVKAVCLLSQNRSLEEIRKETKISESTLSMIQRVAGLIISDAEAKQAAERIAARKNDEKTVDDFNKRLKEIGKQEPYSGWK